MRCIGRIYKIEAGSKELTIKDEHGNDVSLADFKGKMVVIYFYPRDNTPGYKTGMQFQMYMMIFGNRCCCYGISPDKPASHVKET